MSAIGKCKGHARIELLRQHRLDAFNRAFDQYCQGKCGAEHVKYRAAKLREIMMKCR